MYVIKRKSPLLGGVAAAGPSSAHRGGIDLKADRSSHRPVLPGYSRSAPLPIGRSAYLSDGEAQRAVWARTIPQSTIAPPTNVAPFSVSPSHAHATRLAITGSTMARIPARVAVM